MPPETATPPALQLNATINGKPVSLEIEPRAILLDLLRDRLGLTGAKRSCDMQVCGACTVLLDGLPVSACCTLAWEANGRRIETIEGLARPEGLHPIQQAFVDNVAIQCGFCTPGFVLTTKSLLATNPHPSRTEIEAYLGGNLCRCTGYWNILAAVEDAAGRVGIDPHVSCRPAAPRRRENSRHFGAANGLFSQHPNPSPGSTGEGLIEATAPSGNTPSPCAQGEGWGEGLRHQGDSP